MVLLEAMHATTPVVATAVGEISEVLDEGRLGLLVEPDDAEGLGEAIDSALNDPSAAHERARLARHRVAQLYSVGPWVDRVLEVYESAIRHRTL